MSSPSGPEIKPYFVPGASRNGEIREKGSRFLSVLVPVDDEAAVTAALEGVRREHRHATHHCWAWRLGRPARERSADAGEPAGTAGMPILQVLRGAELSDALLVVVRWYGGTKLGKGGLARAYAAAARAAVDDVARLERVEAVTFEVSLPYDQIGAVKQLLDSTGCQLLTEDYGAAVRLELSIGLPGLPRFEEAVADLGPAVAVRRMTRESN